jgi:hypothetical protein
MALSFATASSFGLCPSVRGRGGREGTSIIAQVLSNKKAQNECCNAKVGMFTRLRGQGSRR